MKNVKIRVFLISMILLSLFSGISINNNWGFIYQFEFIDFLQLHGIRFKEVCFWIIVILSHIGIAALPFFVEHHYFRKMLLYFPMTYLLGYLFLRPEFLFLLIPFIIIWSITMIIAKKSILLSQHN